MKEFDEVMSVIEQSKSLGFRTLANGTRVFGHIPHVGSEAWLHTVFPPLNKDGITKVEQGIGESLPGECIKFLHCCNGMNLFFNTLYFYGLRENYIRSVEEAAQQPYDITTPNTLERPRDARAEFIFVGGYDWDGSLLYINSLNGRIHRCEEDSAQSLNEWSSFGEMLTSETQRLSLLFDNEGRQIDPDRPTTP